MSGRAGAFSAGQSDRVSGSSLAACRSVHDRSAPVLAAANTAASWARARRATWDDVAGATSHCGSRTADCGSRTADYGHLAADCGHLAETEGATAVIPFQQTRLDVRPTAGVPLESSRRAAGAAGTTGRRESTGSRLARWLWLPSGSFAAVVLALGGTACAYWLHPRQLAPTRPAVVNGERAPHLSARGQQ